MKINQNDLLYLCVSVYVHIHADFTEAEEVSDPNVGS